MNCPRRSESRRDEVIRICLEEHVPIYQGKIDKTLFQAQLQSLGALPAQH